MSTSPIKVINNLIGFQDQVADFIANGPSTGLSGHVRDQYRKRCDQFANLPDWAQALGDRPTGSLNRICSPYWEAGGFDGPVIERPFTGGQCDGVPYRAVGRLKWNIFINSTGGTSSPDEELSTDLIFTGPVTGIRVVYSNPGSTGPRDFTLIAETGAGDQQLAFRSNPISANSVSGARFEGSFQNAAGTDGGCGDPPGDLAPGPNPPPDPGPTPGPEPTDDPDDPDGVPLLPIPPYSDPIGGPTPIDAPAGGGGAGGNPDSAPGGPENISEPIAVEPTGGEGEETDFGDPPEGRSWVGCLLNFTIPDYLGNIAGSGPTNLVTPRVFGNASLVFAGGRGIAERQNSAWSYLVRPTGALEVTGVYVNSEPGITYTVRPISISNCPENLC